MKKKSDPAVDTSSTKGLKKFSRMQILGAVALITGVILLVLLLQEQPPSNSGSTPSPATNETADNNGVAGSENEPAIQKTNRPPVISAVRLAPEVVLPGIPVRVEVKATDPDQDDIRLDYTWKINNQTITDQSGEEFDTSALRKGDMITVSVIPSDGKEQGRPLESNGVLIQNRPPEITSMPGAGVSSGFFQYHVLAKDPDNDILQYSLEGAPAEMSIDATGLIHWNVPQGLEGKQQVRVIVTDGTASSFQSFNLNLGR